MEYTLKLKPCVLPNFLQFDGGPSGTIPVHQLTDKQAEEYGEFIKQSFIEHHKKLVKKLG